MGIKDDILQIRASRETRKSMSLDFGLKLLKDLKGHIEKWVDRELSDLDKEIDLLRAELGDIPEYSEFLEKGSVDVAELLKWSSNLSGQVEALISRVESGEIEKATKSAVQEIIQQMGSVCLLVVCVQWQIDQMLMPEATALHRSEG